MGDRTGTVTSRREHARHERDLTRVHTVMVCVVLLIVFQFLLLMVAVDGFLGEHSNLLLPTAAASGLCFAAACRLIRYLAARPPRDAR